MQYKAKEVKGMKAAEIRNTICDYVEAVQPNFDGVVVTETLIKVIRAKSTDISGEKVYGARAADSRGERRFPYPRYDFVSTASR
jgi:hypothetical protein